MLLWVVVLVAAKPWWPQCGPGTNRGSSRVAEVLTVHAGKNMKEKGGWSRVW